MNRSEISFFFYFYGLCSLMFKIATKQGILDSDSFDLFNHVVLFD